MNLLSEALIVAITTVIAFSLLYIPFYYIHRDYSKSLTGILLTAFTTGFLIHLAYEQLGWNQAFCEYRSRL